MLSFLHTFEPSPIAFAIGPLSVHWYGLFLGLGALAGYWIVGKLAPKHGLPKDAALGIFVNALIGGFVGARAYHVVTDWEFYGSNADQIIAVWNGGLAIHGAMLGVAAVALYFAKKYHLNIGKLADVFALAAILGQAIGRWGNYFNQELFGRPTDLLFGIPISPINRPPAFAQYEYFHPAFLYESLGNLVIFGILLLVFKKQRTTPLPPPGYKRGNTDGLIFWLYLGLYSGGRIIIESFKINDAAMVGSLRLPLLVSVLLAVAAIVALLKPLAFKHKP